MDAGQTLSLKGIGAQGDGLRAYLAIEGMLHHARAGEHGDL